MPYVTKERGEKGREATLARQEVDQKPRPDTRIVYVNRSHTHDPSGENAVRVTLPKEPWL